MKKTRFFLALLSAAAVLAPLAVRAQDEVAAEDSTTAAMEEAPTATSDPDLTELQEQVALPTTARLESQEDPANPKPIFPEDQLRKILSDKPRFIYYPEGVDPMLIPWTREKVMAQEIFAEAQVAQANDDLQKAIDLYTKVLEQFPNTVEGQRAPAAIDAVRQVVEEKARIATGGVIVPPGPSGNEIVLPAWIEANTTAVMLGPNPVVIVGDDFLRPGDFVPKYSAVTIKSITDAEVVYLYEGLEFSVQVSGIPESL